MSYMLNGMLVVTAQEVAGTDSSPRECYYKADAVRYTAEVRAGFTVRVVKVGKYWRVQAVLNGQTFWLDTHGMLQQVV